MKSSSDGPISCHPSHLVRGQKHRTLMETQNFVQDDSDHHHVHAGVGLVSVGNLARVLQRVHEGFQLYISTLEWIC